MPDSPLDRVTALGQSVWIDFLSRELLESGELERMMREDAIRGVTSNPTIFQKAMAEGSRYDAQLEQLSGSSEDTAEIFYALASQDVGNACDLMRSVWDGGRGLAGYVSIEVDPTIAADTDATTQQALELHAAIDKPNLYVKIPATKAGLPSIEDMIAAGHSINVTLIFSLERHREVMEAYIRGLERLRAAGGDLEAVSSVASYFVSRVDTEADKRLDEIGGHDTLKGKLAVANAKLAYRNWQETFSGLALASARGGRRVEAVVPLGLDLDEEPGVLRRPLRRDADRAGHGEHDAGGDDPRLPGPRARGRDARRRASTRRRRSSARFAEAGVDYDDVTETLEREGVEKFSDSFAEALDGIRAKQGELASA